MSGKDNKKQNFRQRLRSMREDWSDGPLLASSEDINDVVDDSSFITACRNRRGNKKVKLPELENEQLDERNSLTPSICENPSDEPAKAIQRSDSKLDLTTKSESSNRLGNNVERIDDTCEKILQQINVTSEPKTSTEDALSCRKVPWSNSASDDTKRVHDSDECAICYQPWRGDKVILEECGHCFHSLCIHTWKKRKNTCPFCKTYFILLDDYPKLS